MVYLIHLFSY